MKKKLEETYMPEKDARRKRLVVGMSGGINSSVTAYLLKIQKYELIGVTILAPWEDYKGETSDILSCHITPQKIDQIKEFCHQLGIPHMVIKAADEFKEEVVESWVAARISGTLPNPCWNCHSLRMKLLHEKMVELEAQGLATGHLAKLFHQEAHGSVYVHTSNDDINDQSSILSRLPHEVLDKLMLPLSDLTQKEITKLAENFGIVSSEKKIKMHQCFDIKHVEEDFLSVLVPKKYQKIGEMVGADKSSLGDHSGILHYPYGRPVPVPGQRQNEEFYISKYNVLEKKLEVAGPDYSIRKKIFLNHCKVSEETPWVEPLKGTMKLSETEFMDCWIYPKNISSAVIEFEAPAKVLEGEIVSLFKKKGRNSKVFLSGKVRYIPEVVEEEEGKESVKVDYSRDF